jgi:patatin-like phospholipase/acyl hydrolase
MADPDGKSIKVLSIDGGGIRGIIAAVILKKILDWVGRPAHEIFGLIAGTSTSGIIALGLGTRSHNGEPYSPQGVLDLYLENGDAIFKKGAFTILKQFSSPKYAAKPLETVLEKYFGKMTIESALVPLLISSYNLRGQLPFFFKSQAFHKDEFIAWKVTDIARATSAAPTFFPPKHLTWRSGDFALVDGGIYVNNPAMAAYAEACRPYPDASKFVVVPVGTGNRQDHIGYFPAKYWGLLGWASKIVPIFMDSVSEAVDHELKQMPDCVYCRLQPPDLSAASNNMDNVDPENLEALQTVAGNYLESVRTDVECAVGNLSGGRGSNLPGYGLMANFR